ncbi:MAG: hypothetical protein U0R70_12525 [Solirubrobacteraceae bacterium]
MASARPRALSCPPAVALPGVVGVAFGAAWLGEADPSGLRTLRVSWPELPPRLDAQLMGFATSRLGDVAHRQEVRVEVRRGFRQAVGGRLGAPRRT